MFILFFSVALVYATLITLVPTTATPVQSSYSGYVTEGTLTIVTKTTLLAACYVGVNSSNDVWCLEDEGTNARDAYFVTNFTMPSGTINSVFVRGEGKSTSTSAGSCTLALWNVTAGAWQSKASGSCTTTDVVLSYNISTANQKTNFIDGTIVRAMYVLLSSAVTDDLNLDQLRAQVDYTPAADTCTYGGSGNWVINCADNCVKTTNTDVGARKNNITITGTGTFTLSKGNITGYKDIFIKGTDANNRCVVTCGNGGCFK